MKIEITEPANNIIIVRTHKIEMTFISNFIPVLLRSSSGTMGKETLQL